MAFTYKNNPLNDGTYVITSSFGYRSSIETSKGSTSSSHKGIDLGTYNESAEPIFAVADGTVSAVRYEEDGYGYYVILEHTDGVETRYAHMKDSSPLKVGDKVSAGDQIGNVGNTGSSTGPHLHFEIRVNGTPIDPEPYITSGATTILSPSYTDNQDTSNSAGTITYTGGEAAGTTVGQRVSGVSKQPLHPFISIYVGDNQRLLSTDPPKPNMIQSFEYTRLDGAGETAILTLFDNNWEEVEAALSANYDKIYIQYGYPGTGMRSKLHKHLLLNYNLSFESTGTILSVESITEGAVDNLTQQSIALNTFNPTEAVKTICKALGYIVLDENFDKSEDIHADDPFNMVEEFPISYIQNTIIPQASQENEELFSFEVDSEGVAYFKRESYETTATDSMRTYIYQKGYDSNVIDFSVDIKAIFGGTGTFQTATTYRSTVFDTKTKSASSYTINKSTVVTSATGDQTHTRYNQSNPTVDSAGYSPYQAKNRLYYHMKSMANDAYGARLVIVGDPTIRLHEFVRVINVTDKGYLHHTSGVYVVMGIVDSIHGGEYTTTLNLVKNATAGDIDGLEIINPKTMIK